MCLVKINSGYKIFILGLYLSACKDSRNLRVGGGVFVLDTASGDVYCPEEEGGLAGLVVLNP